MVSAAWIEMHQSGPRPLGDVLPLLLVSAKGSGAASCCREEQAPAGRGRGTCPFLTQYRAA